MRRARVFAVAVTAILVLAALPLLASGGKESGGSAEAASGAFATHYDISMGIWEVGKAFPQGGGPDAVRDALYKKLNITIVPFDFGWGDDAMQKIQLWYASNQLPDFIAGDIITKPLYEQWIKQGVVQALPSDLSPYPNVKQVVNSLKAYITYPMGDPKGKVYGVPRGSYKNLIDNATTVGFFERKDWRIQAGIKNAPQTLDEFKNVLRAYVKMGKVGLTAYNAQWIVALMNGYEPGVSNNVYYFIRQDGKWVPAFMSKNILAGLKNIQSMFNEGLIDKDVTLFKAEEGLDKFFSGKAGAVGMSTDISGVDYFKKYDALNPGAKWEEVFEWVPVSPAADGKRYADTTAGFWSETYINAKAEPGKADRILHLLDFYLSTEGVNLIRNGIEGVDYSKAADGTITPIQTKDANGKVYDDITLKYPACYLGWVAQWSGENVLTLPGEAKAVAFEKPIFDFVRKNYKNTFTDYRLNLLQFPAKKDMTADFEVDMIQAVLSKDIDKEWAGIVQNHLNNGYTEIIKEVNDIATAQGIK